MDVKTLCLGALSLKPATGYDIRKYFQEEGPFSHFQDAAFGSIYPALKRLVEEGLVTGTDEPQESRPDKRVYTITPAGMRALQDALVQPPAPDKVRSDFTFILYFGHLLPPDHLHRLVEARMAWLRDLLGRMDECKERPMEAGPAFTLGLGIAVYRAALQYMEEHRHELAGAPVQPRSETAS